MTEKKSISILGCGWLGLPLGKYLISRDYRVLGSVTGTEKLSTLSEAGIQPFQIDVQPGKALSHSELFDSDILIINIPPKRTEDVESRYPAQIKEILRAAANGKVKHVLFTGSTSVYPEINDRVDESFKGIPSKASGRALLEVEKMIMNSDNFTGTVLRFGGLIGEDRNPAISLSRKKIRITADAPVNLIHRDDCIQIIENVIEKEKWGYVFNACAPEHPTKSEFYSHAARQQNVPLPKFKDGKVDFKIVDSSCLIKELDYTFAYPDPMKMY